MLLPPPLTPKGFQMKSAEIRKGQILEILSRNSQVKISDLCEQMGSSATTIRTSLADLEEQHILRTSKGLVYLNPALPMAALLVTNYNGKKRIVREASALIGPGDRIFVDAGPCSVSLVEELMILDKEFTLFTNSIYLASRCGRYPNCRLSLVGGDYDFYMAGMMPSKSIPLPPLPQVDFVFADVGPYQIGQGFTSLFPREDLLIQEFSKRSRDTIVMVQSTAVSPTPASIVLEPNLVTQAITDKVPSVFVQSDLREYLIRLITV